MVDDPIGMMEHELRRRGVANSITREVAAAVRRIYGGGQVYIRAIDREGRDREIRAALARGLSPEETARQAGTSVATVRRRRSVWL